MLGLRTTLISIACCFAATAGATDGLITVQSPYSVAKTLDRFEAAAKSRGFNIFLRLDHAAAANKVGKNLRPTELLVFGNPQSGTPLMECSQTAGIDLPLKALAWQDAGGSVWFAYNDPKYLALRHVVGDCGLNLEKVSRTLEGLTQDALQK